MKKILDIQHLSILFKNGDQLFTAVDDISFAVEANQFTAIVGESGSGKSLTALSILNLLPSSAVVKGCVLFSGDNDSVDVLSCPTKKLNYLRGNRISMVFQEPMTALNPLMTCGMQVSEVLVHHLGLS
jgi:ABC-type dipeptide/oligopeptide/nickel transport system ATPase component